MSGSWKEAIFINDLGYILADQNPDTFGNSHYAIFLNLIAFFFAFLSYYLYEMKLGMVGFAIAYCMGLAEAFNNPIYKHLCNMMSYEDLIHHIKHKISQAPKLTMVYRNFHYHTEKGKQKKKYTTECRETFRYAEFMDLSPELKSIEHVKSTALTRVEFDKVITYSVQAN